MYSQEDIKSLFKELEHYESTGKYRLADRIWQSLIKVAYQPQAKDLGQYGTAFSNAMNFDAFRKFIMTIPACQELFNTNPNAQAAIYGDFKDQVGANFATGMSLENAVAAVGLNSTSDHPTWNLPNDESFKTMFANCMKGIGKSAASFGGQFKDVTTTNKATSAPQRNVPQMPSR